MSVTRRDSGTVGSGASRRGREKRRGRHRSGPGRARGDGTDGTGFGGCSRDEASASMRCPGREWTLSTSNAEGAQKPREGRSKRRSHTSHGAAGASEPGDSACTERELGGVELRLGSAAPVTAARARLRRSEEGHEGSASSPHRAREAARAKPVKTTSRGARSRPRLRSDEQLARVVHTLKTQTNSTGGRRGQPLGLRPEARRSSAQALVCGGEAASTRASARRRSARQNAAGHPPRPRERGAEARRR